MTRSESLLILSLFASPCLRPLLAQPRRDSIAFIRFNQLGYRPSGRKVAVVCSLDSSGVRSFSLLDQKGRTAWGPKRPVQGGAFGPCTTTQRLDFSALQREGSYRLAAAPAETVTVRISMHAYEGAADTLLYYMREQRSGWNPVFRDSVHRRDGIIVDDPRHQGTFIPVSGGWADASDYLQYVTTSANATFLMLMAYRDHPMAFADRFLANGLPGTNDSPDVLDEARHGLEWLVSMYPTDDQMYNQVADDRDHSYFDLPTNDSSDYGWGKGRERPVYPCTGSPQGLFAYRNRSTGWASTAGKYAAAFALGARLFRERDPVFSELLRSKALAANAAGVAHPGVCQTAPARAPYFYEEDNWVDDMELAAAELHSLTGEKRYLEQALAYASREPVTPWMGQDTARHYQFYPWHNNGHFEIWRNADDAGKRAMSLNYRQGLELVARRAGNGFRVGIPFIWCSNDLMVSLATQALLYRQMTGDTQFLELENAAIDWLFGTNPWGMSMVIGLPHGGATPRDPHSAIARQLGIELTGGLIDGPVKRSIFESLRGIRLLKPDAFARFNTGALVYHDDLGDYSTNEPIMDGTANLVYLLSALEGR
ncbi:MAG: glycoside hydrolase family 9 protein [Gemmatimonadota bacterium]|nr:glycoside hydrolase family 9 protein [Gemmatimonadota bacterium]